VWCMCWWCVCHDGVNTLCVLVMCDVLVVYVLAVCYAVFVLVTW